jgi:hypothetical protein
VLERQPVKPQRNRHAAHEGGVELADQDHGGRAGCAARTGESTACQIATTVA